MGLRCVTPDIYRSFLFGDFYCFTLKNVNMQILIIIAVVILFLVAGYYFLTRFDKMDSYFFENSESGYESFGSLIVYISAFSGAIASAVFFYVQVFDRHADELRLNT